MEVIAQQIGDLAFGATGIGAIDNALRNDVVSVDTDVLDSVKIVRRETFLADLLVSVKGTLRDGGRVGVTGVAIRLVIEPTNTLVTGILVDIVVLAVLDLFGFLTLKEVFFDEDSVIGAA